MLADLLRDAGHSLQTLRPDLGEALPDDVSPYAGIIIMGGPQSANDTHLSCIRTELRWLERCIAEGKPMLGICLGAQLMAKAAGGSISKSPKRELGWHPVFPAPQAATDPLFSDIPASGLTVFQWHGETFSLPLLTTLLACHPDVPAQAFRIGKGQYGLQFHVEVNTGLIGQWIEAGDGEREHLGCSGIVALHAATPLHLEAMQDFCRSMMRNWLALLHG